MTPATALPDEAASLFRESPEAFIAARDALASRLREDGRGDDAATVKALRKPTVVAWALNQLSDRDPDGVRALVAAGAEVRAAQQAALSSKRGAAERLRSAGAARREAVGTLSSSAIDALAEAGRASSAHADAIGAALEVCSVDPDAGEALSAGTMERPPAADAGFGDVFGLTSIEGGGEPAEQASGTKPGASRSTAKRAARGAGVPATERAELRAAVARLRRDRDAAARRTRRAREAADGFAHELDGMRRRLEVVERKHADAATAASEGELELARVERRLKAATARLEDDGVG